MTPVTLTLGAIAGEHGTSFRVYAPVQESVSLVLEGDRELPTTRDAEGYFTVTVPHVRAGARYWYRLREGLRPDPASRFQPEGPLGPSEVVDSGRYRWSDADWPGAPAPHAHAIYELHIGTYTREGTWAAAAARLPRLRDLGSTTIEVMPVAEFSGEFGWGYDGVDLFAPSHLYGAPDDARRFVDAAHRLGLAVILDVVYNHFGPIGNFLRDFAPMFFGKPGEWGDTMNYDGPGSIPVRRFVCENAAHWIREYHLDGLRFDATQGIYDSSSEHVISEIARAARAAAGSKRIFLVGESETQDVRLLRDSRAYPDGLDALWNEDWHHAAYVALTGRRQAYFTDYQGTAGEFASMARHGFLYQGQWYSWQTRPRGGFSIGFPSSAFVAFLENHDQAANTGLGSRLVSQVDRGKWRAVTALLMLGPQLPMLFQGQEFASTRPFTYFADHHGELGDAVRRGRLEFLSQFPGLTSSEMADRLPSPSSREAYQACKLDHCECASQMSDIALHRDLLQLRRRDAVLSRVGTAGVAVECSSPAATIVLVRYLAAEGHRLLVVNLGADHLSPMNDPLFAPAPGTQWSVVWASEHPDYGGGGIAPFVEAGRWLIRGASATLLES